MKFFFIVQGEGMGHTTQAIALREILEKNGHEVSATYLGRNFSGKNNQLFSSIPHSCFFSPVFLKRQDKMGISLIPTFLYNILFSPVYFFEIFRLAWNIRSSDARVVIVFYDMIGQLAAFLSFSGKPVFSISHHYFFEHPAFIWPERRKAEKAMLLIHSWLASLGVRKKLALSFTNEKPLPRKKLEVIPPLLRRAILDSEPVCGEYILVYCLQPGFLKLIIRLATQYPGKKFHVFLHEIKTGTQLPSNLKVLPISGDRFLDSIINAGTVICTSGFETLAEAIYLDKPLLVFPSKGHFEQYCNALDAKRAGAALVIDDWNYSEMRLLKGNPAHKEFVKWIAGNEEKIVKILTE